jgi:L-lactate permease
VQQQRGPGLVIWIAVVIAACAALGGWLGSQLGDGGTGMVVLVAATLGVLGSFLPGSVLRAVSRLRRSGGPPHGPA